VSASGNFDFDVPGASSGSVTLSPSDTFNFTEAGNYLVTANLRVLDGNGQELSLLVDGIPITGQSLQDGVVEYVTLQAIVSAVTVPQTLNVSNTGIASCDVSNGTISILKLN